VGSETYSAVTARALFDLIRGRQLGTVTLDSDVGRGTRFTIELETTPSPE
jgi:hypothetical protein